MIKRLGLLFGLTISFPVAVMIFGLLSLPAPSVSYAQFMTNTPMPNIPVTPVPVTQVADDSTKKSTDDAPDAATADETITAATSAGYAVDWVEKMALPEFCAYVPNQPITQACLDFIAANPAPNVEQIRPDGFTLEQYDFWRIGPEAVNTYDAPGGTVTGQRGAGFNFVTVVNEANGFIQTEAGDWLNVAESNAYHVTPSFFRGVTIPEDWNVPFGFVLDTTGIWASTEPGGDPTAESGLIPLRYEVFPIYAVEKDSDDWNWYMVGPNQWVKQIYMTIIKPIQPPAGVGDARWVSIDLYEQSLVAYEGNRPVYATLVSTGLPQYSTNEGLFEVWAALPSDPMSGSTGAPNAYALQRVPWVQYFDGSISLHGTYWHDYFGYRRSRGCVNLTISDSRWVYEWMQSAPPNAAGEVVNYVYVHSTGEYRSDEPQ